MSDLEPSHRRPGALAKTVLAGLAVTLALGGCGSSHAAGTDTGTSTDSATVDTLAPPTKVTASAVTVDAIDNDFTPKNLVIRPGTKVTFANTGHNLHDVTPAATGTFDFTVSSDKFAPGTSKTVTFTKPGTYGYFCSLHATATAGSMRGVITVAR